MKPDRKCNQGTMTLAWVLTSEGFPYLQDIYGVRLALLLALNTPNGHSGAYLLVGLAEHILETRKPH